MQQLDIVHDRLDYVGLLATPAFRLFANPAALAVGLYQTFQWYHTGTEAISFEGEQAKPLQRSCVVALGNFGTYRLTPERVEWTRPDAWASQLESSVLALGDAWLRQLASGAALMHSHYFTYSAHVAPVGSMARDILVEMGGPALPGFGTTEGTGLIFHTRVLPENFEVRFTLDHSNEATNGLFVEMIVTFEHDIIDYTRTGPYLVEVLHRALRSLNLELVQGVG